MPPWLAERMEKLGTAISESVIHHYGTPRIAVPTERPVLVSGAWRSDGHGLAFVRDHHLGAGRAEARAEPAGKRAGSLRLRRTREAIAQYAPGIASHCRKRRAWTAMSWYGPAG